MSAVTKMRWRTSDPNPEVFPFFENAPLVVVRISPDGRLDAFNPQLKLMADRLLGHRLGNASQTDLRFVELIDPPEKGEHLLRELFAGECDCFQIDSIFCDQNGRPTQWTAWKVSGRAGETDYALAFALPFSENREAERQHEAEKLEVLGRLAGGVAHDFNNLLTGVLLYCDLLMASLEPGSRASKYAEEIRRAGMQATTLVKQLLAVAGRKHLGPRPLSLNEMAEGMRNLLLRLIGENIELTFDLDPNLGLVRMDPAQAQQLLLNLVLNARDAMPSGGQIVVATSNCRMQLLEIHGRALPGQESSASAHSDTRGLMLPCVLFAVRDNGKGMDAPTRARIFQTFFSTKSNGNGTGLGLATVQNIVAGCGGLIHVDSIPGTGTRFSVLLPLAPDAAALPSARGPEEKIEGEFSATKKQE